MAAKNSRKSSSGSETSTPILPTANPAPNHDNWTMQSIVQLTAAVGKLETAINNIGEKIDNVRDEQAALQGRIDKVERKILIAATIFTIVIAIGTFVIGSAGYVANKAIDFGLDVAKVKLQEPAASQPTPSPSVKQ